MAEQAQEVENEQIAIKNIGATASLFSPEALIMLSLAVFIDAGEFLLEFIPGVGQVLSIIVDIFAVIFFGSWMWFRSREITVPKKTGKMITKGKAKITKWSKRLKWLRPLCFIIELVPIFSSLAPLWILIVYLELKHNT